MNMRQYLASGVFGLSALVSPSCGYAQEATPTPQAIVSPKPSATSAPSTTPKPSPIASPKPSEKPRLTLEQIAEEMKKPSVEAILKDTGIEYITDANFNDKVIKGKKPSVVMFYDDNHEFNKREAIILKELQNEFKDKINVYALQITKKTFEQMAKEKKSGKIVTSYRNLAGIPSLALYHKIDFANSNNHDGKNGSEENKQIDILRGGPTADKWIVGWLYEGWDTVPNWVTSLLISPLEDEKGKYVQKCNNSTDAKKVYLSNGTQNLNNKDISLKE